MASDGTGSGISRRTLLVGGGVGVGLALAWGLWPRSFSPNLRAAPGETLFNAFLKIGRDGRIIVAVPQAEIGQGVYTSLPQIIADELGADWRTVAVEPAPLNPIYANHFLAEEHAGTGLPSAFQDIGRWAAREYASRTALMMTGGSTSIRAFEGRLREAGAAARALLSMAAANRWDTDWEALDAGEGFIINGNERIRFAELAEEAAGYEPPENPPLRGGIENRLLGQSVPRLDLPAKVDGSAQYAADIRLPDMVYASVRQGPIGDSRLVRVNQAAADRVAGVMAIVQNDGWVGAAATNWWAANRAIEAMKPVFETMGSLVETADVEQALSAALEGGDATRFYSHGEDDEAGGNVFRAHYSVGLAANAPMEPLTATARVTGGTVEVWAPTQAPGLARAAAARAAGFSEEQVVVYPTMIGSGYGRKLETTAIEQAVIMAMHVKRPVQLVWSRLEETMQDTFRPPARASMSARMGPGGRIANWEARIAAPATTAQVMARIRGGSGVSSAADASAVDGAVPPYAIPAVAIDHLPADVRLKTGIWRSGAHSYTAFFTESFIDELARQANIEPMSFRMQMLGDNPRLARVLSTAATLGGWDGGAPGSAMGIAAHSSFGSHAATLVEVAIGSDQKVQVRRAVCAVDVGRVVNPDIVRQVVEGGLIYGIAGATGARIEIENGLPEIRGIGALDLPRLANSPEITVEIVESEDDPGGATELSVPTIAPAIANAVYAATGRRLRSLPLTIGRA